jgi:hypothetical protein
MMTTIFTVTGSDPALPLGGLPTNVQNTSDVLFALRAVRKMQASGLQGINVVADGQSVPIGRLETLVNDAISEFIAKSTNEDLLKEYEHTRGETADPRTAPLLAEIQRRSLA